MKIILTDRFPFGRYTTINIFGVLFTKTPYLSSEVILHEQIHTAQMKEMLFIFFYIWYACEYLFIRLFHKKRHDAYKDISFEEEAYNNMCNRQYLFTRKRYAWFKYVKLKSNKVWTH